MQLADLEIVRLEVGQQLRGELVDIKQRVRAVRGTAMSRLQILDVAADEELELVAGPNLKAELGRAVDLRGEHAALVVGPR